jgi:tetratricopeptide (TPR) repeat protein
MNVRSLPLLVLPLLLACAAPRPPLNLGPPQPQTLAQVDATLAALRPILAFAPPAIESDGEREEVLRQWKATEAALKRLAAADPRNAALQVRLGILYRYGHNLGVITAGAACIEHLERAIALDPDDAAAYLELGIFLTDAGSRFASFGEANLKKAIELTAPEPLPRAWRALAYAYYYQGRFTESAAAANRYLALNPSSQAVRRIKAAAEKAAAGGGLPGNTDD